MPGFDRHAAERVFHERWTIAAWPEREALILRVMNDEAVHMADGYLALQRTGAADMRGAQKRLQRGRHPDPEYHAQRADRGMHRLRQCAEELEELEGLRRRLAGTIKAAVEENLGMACMDLLERGVGDDATCLELVTCYIAAAAAPRSVFDHTYLMKGYEQLQARCAYLNLPDAIAEAEAHFRSAYCAKDASVSYDAVMAVPPAALVRRTGSGAKQIGREARLEYIRLRIGSSQLMSKNYIAMIEEIRARAEAAVQGQGQGQGSRA
jgi:hypothetical protein